MTIKLPTTLTARFLQWYSNLWPIRYPKAPYDHICPVGDQSLRCKAQCVDVNAINSKEIQTLIQKMIKVLRRNNLVGISAPQIGSSYQIFIVEFTSKEMSKYHPDIAKIREIEEFPLKVFINPRMTIVNNNLIKFPEGCACIKGYSAVVPRFYEIKVKAYDMVGKEFELQTKGWISRIIQHEMDHLKGQLYVDIMDTHTFQFDLWQIVNKSKGKIPWLRLKYR